MANLSLILTEKYWKYPQTWYFMPRIRWLRKTLQFLHGLWGHHWSKTEWGYGGGDRLDVWCRWCDKQSTIPMETARFYFPQLAGFRPLINRVKSNTESEGADHG
jgi:hypothetical protein